MRRQEISLVRSTIVISPGPSNFDYLSFGVAGTTIRTMLIRSLELEFVFIPSFKFDFSFKLLFPTYA